MDNQTENEFEIDKRLIEDLKQNHPEKIIHQDPQFIPQDLEKIGIEFSNPNLPEGYLRYYLEDFIVEEVDTLGKLHTIEIEEEPFIPLQVIERDFLYATLVKGGIPTQEAIARISKILEIEPKEISYAGLKDAIAISAQRVCLDKLLANKLINLKFANLFLKEFSYQKGKISPGDLRGNRFTILVRTKEKVDEEKFKNNLENLRTNGFLNFYSFQRFGRRLNIQWIGLLILQGKYQEAILKFLTETSSYEMPYVNEIRQNVKNWFGNWQKMKEFYDILPYYFGQERQILEALVERPQDLKYPFLKVQFLTRLFVWAFNSYLFNSLMSYLKNNNLSLPETLPFFSLNLNPQSLEIYRPILEEEKIDSQTINPSNFRFLSGEGRGEQTKVMPRIYGFKVIEQGVILDFELPPGAYATTFLPNLFVLYHAFPQPEWIKKDKGDSKQILGTGSVLKTLEQLEIPQETEELTESE